MADAIVEPPTLAEYQALAGATRAVLAWHRLQGERPRLGFDRANDAANLALIMVGRCASNLGPDPLRWHLGHFRVDRRLARAASDEIGRILDCWPDPIDLERLAEALAALDAAIELVEAFEAMAPAAQEAIERASRAGPPIVNAKRDDQIRAWRYRDRKPVKEVIRLVKVTYDDTITTTRVSQIAPAKDRESWMLANPEES